MASLQQSLGLLFLVLLAAGCGKKEVAPALPSTPLVIACTPAIAEFAKAVAGSEVSIYAPVPNGTNGLSWAPDAAGLSAMEAQLKMTTGRVVVLVPDLKDLPAWMTQLGAKAGGVERLPYAQPALTPGMAAELLEQIISVVAQLKADKTQIKSRGAALRKTSLDPLVERWNAAVNGVPENAALLALGERFGPLKKAFPFEVTIVTAETLASLAEDTGARHLIVAQQPGAPAVKEAIEEAGLEVVVLDPGQVRGSASFLATLEENVGSTEKLCLGLIEAFSSVELDTSYEGGVLPLLERYCMECHDEENEEGEVNFENFMTEAKAVKDPDFWDSVAAQLEIGSMPPPKKEQPSEAERDHLVAWTQELSGRWDEGEFGSDPGRTTIRRLNKNEFNYTIRDLFRLKIRPADGFPEDGGGAAGFDNNADALFLPPLLMENYVEAAGVIAEAVFANASTRKRFLFVSPVAGVSEGQAATKILNAWASRAYRRKASEAEIGKLLKIYAGERKKKKSHAQSMQMSLLAMLISPNFLYRSETEKPGSTAYPVDGFDLANRLSYFLWSSMPDTELFQLAARGELQKEEVLEAQVLRMLADPKSASLAMHFGGQWFGWEQLRSRANPDKERYPEFGFPLRIAMYQESTIFFQHLIKENASAYDLIDCDYAFLNDRLAAHYRIAGVTGPEFRKVALTDRNRGGVLGMGSVLVATSLPLRSSPAVRGDYVLGDILGTPPPEPPMNVEQLPEDDHEIKAHSFREALEQHRSDPNCKSCHETIDPIGFGLENFDAIGRWRTEQNGHPIDANGEMPDGSRITSPADIKLLLMQDKALFARNFSEKLLSYALGRELTPYDRPVTAKIAAKIIEGGGSIHAAFVEVAKSYPFRNRRNDNFQPKP